MAICGDNPLLSVKQEGMGMSDSIEYPATAQWKLGKKEEEGESASTE